MSDTPTPLSIHIFRGSRLKIQRAERHIAELSRVIDEHFLSNLPKFDIHIPQEGVKDGEQIRVDVSVSFNIPGVPDEWGPIIGDVVHNLRSALDMMACELVRLNKRSDKSVYFPFCD